MLSLKAKLIFSIKIAFGIWMKFWLFMGLHNSLHWSNNVATATCDTSDFSYKNLTDTPFICEEFTELNFSHNRFNKVPELQKLRNLSILDLSYNSLKFIFKNDFVNLTSLRKIDLRNNTILKIQPGTFADLKSIEQVFLGNNSLGVLDVRLFANLENLTLVSLVGNLDLCLQGYDETFRFIKWTQSSNKHNSCANHDQPVPSDYNVTMPENLETDVTQITDEGNSSVSYTSEGDSSTTCTCSCSPKSENEAWEDNRHVNLKDLFVEYFHISLAIITGLTFNIITLALYLHMNWRIKISVTRKIYH